MPCLVGDGRPSSQRPQQSAMDVCALARYVKVFKVMHLMHIILFFSLPLSINDSRDRQILKFLSSAFNALLCIVNVTVSSQSPFPAHTVNPPPTPPVQQEPLNISPCSPAGLELSPPASASVVLILETCHHTWL